MPCSSPRTWSSFRRTTPTRTWPHGGEDCLGCPTIPPSAGEFDVVVVGGGIAGCSAALTAARLGLQVAFIQNRPVLGGNASPEIGITVRGQNRSVVSEVAGPDREKAIRAEKNIHLYLGWHVFRAQTQGNQIESVDAKNTCHQQGTSVRGTGIH